MTKNKKIKAIITVNLYGMPYKVDEVHAIAEKYGIPIEDSAEALGSSYKGKNAAHLEPSLLSFNG
jgi:dTDP-4-amino-4,6-dideoxygalactose transaminase